MARPLEDWMIPLIKGMLARGDDQSDIAACFMINSGRVAEINTGQRSPEVKAAPPEELPPRPPYPTPYELFQMKKALGSLRSMIRLAIEKQQSSLGALDDIERRFGI